MDINSKEATFVNLAVQSEIIVEKLKILKSRPISNVPSVRKDREYEIKLLEVENKILLKYIKSFDDAINNKNPQQNNSWTDK